MQKVSYKFKKLITAISLGVVLLLAGLFFVGCGESAASRLTITPDKTSVSIFTGESTDITFSLGNYESGVDSTISFSLIDSTVASATSEHVTLEVISQQETQTTVRVTGVSGGTTTLVATTNEGSKQAFVNIEVRQYSSSISLKDGQLLYVTDESPFAPNEQMYNFESNATERNLTFHRTELASEISEENAFVSANLTFDAENGQYLINFVKENGETFGESVVSLGTQINFMARYENGQTLEVQTLLSYFTVLPALEENAIELYVGEQPVDVAEGLTIVANDVAGRESINLTIKVPSHIENAGTDAEQNFITFEDEVQDNSLLTITRSKVAEGDPLFEAGYATYVYQISSATIQAASTNLNLSLFYTIGNQSFESADDDAVSQQLSLPINIRVAPDSVVVNGYEQNAPENNYNFYNYYDGDYGWQQFNVEVFRTDSSFDYVEMTFDNDVVVRYQNRLVSSPLQITDISEPVYVRGASSVSPTTQQKQIQFKVVSEYISEGNDNVIYNVNYTISTGATTLTFDDPTAPYEYNENNDNSGIFISSSASAQVFAHLVSDYAFESVSPIFYEGDASAVIVEYISPDEAEFDTEANTVYLRVEPRRTGIATYRIMLDNGVSKLITFRVIDTFDDLAVNLSGTENNGVLSYEKVQPSDDPELGQLSDEMNIVLQNLAGYDENNQPITIYGRNATVQLSSSSGADIFDSIEYDFSNINLLGIVQNGAATYTVSTNSYGETVLDFAVSGVVVNEDFIKQTDTKYARVNFVSTVSVSQFNVNTDDGVSAYSVNLFVGNNISDASLQTATFSTVVNPSNAYGFYDPELDTLVNDTFKQEYVYWTLNDTTYSYIAATNELVDRMVYGNIYRIGASYDNYFGLFDTTTMTFTVNPNYGYEFSFTLFASLRQYSGARYFPINVQGQAYDNVTNIYTNIDQATNLVFSPSQTYFEIAVFLNPIAATDKDIVVRYISSNENADDISLINLPNILYSNSQQSENGDVTITKINDNGTWLIGVTLNNEVLAAEGLGSLSGTLQIIPNAWFVDEEIASGYQNNIVSITFNYADGSEENPFWLQNAQDVIAIGTSRAAMEAHYRLETTIDMSAYASYLPLGKNLTSDGTVVAFSGSIVSESGDGVITGLTITEGVNDQYGMFAEVSGTISNITFEGNINVSTENSVNVGLVAGVLNGTLDGISARLAASSVNAAYGNIGGLVGENNGTISNMNVLFDAQMSVRVSNGNQNTFVGGIAGYSTGAIQGRTEEERASLFGYGAYSVYAMIDVRDNSQNLAGNAAAVSGYSSGSITQILAGGEIFANSAAGIVREMTGGQLNTITTRVFVRGNEIGLIAISITSNVELPNTTFPGNSAGNIKVQSTDDGVRTGIYASMAVLFTDITSIETSPLYGLEENARNSKLAFWLGRTEDGGNSYTSVDCLSFAEFSSYITREAVPKETSIRNNFTIDQFYADVVIVNEATDEVIDIHNFQDMSTAFSIKPNEDNGFYQFESANGGDIKVINAYYFEAAGSYQNGNFTTSNLYAAQEALDPLNTLNVGDSLYPIIIEGSDVTMTSSSSILEISSTGQIVVKGTGLARVEISSLLNQKENEVIYFNVINYFNVQSYKINSDIIGDDDEVVLERQTGIFTIGNLTLGENARFNVYSNAGVDVLISPSYILNTTIEDVSGNQKPVSISRDGLVTIDGNLIQLVKNYSVSASVDAVDGEMQYGTYEESRDGLTFVKTSSATTDDGTMQDKINLSAAIVANVDGQEYKLDITTLDNVTINYYEGATAINTVKDRYVLTPSSGDTDLVVITSDYVNDTLVTTDGQLEIVDEEGVATDLFNATVTESGDLQFNLSINVDKNSTAFANRRAQNIYKTYYLNLRAVSNPDTILKTIEIALHQENVDTIIVNNFPSISGIEDSNFVVPGRAGVLSVTLSPIDADFDYVEITNNAINSLQGASIASFTLGTYDSSNGSFTEIAGAEITANGIRISRQVLESISGYQGQFYIRYMFSNNNIVDGQSVAVDIAVTYDDGVFSQSFPFTIYRQEFVSVDFAEYPGKTQVARGLTYDLNVQAVGYEEITLTTSNPQLAQIVLDEQTGTYQLVITNDTIDYAGGNNTFAVMLTATRTNEFGQEVTAGDSIEITILEYVINYSYNNENQDIISGMVDGTIDVAVGDRMSLSVGFEDMIEYNAANTTVVALVENFLSELTNSGTWTLYTDLNVNNDQGIPIYSIPLQKEASTASVLTPDNSISIQYLSTSGLSLTTYRAHQVSSRRYFFSYEANYRISGGVYTFVGSDDTAGEASRIYTEFDIYSFMRGSEESPIPITTYEEFLTMEAGGYYILLNDIEVPAETFVPLETQIAYFDGNNFKFIFSDEQYDIGTLTQAGLFGSVGASTILKNITIEIGSDDVSAVSFASSASTAVVFGLVAGVNNGAITNASVQTNQNTTVYLTFTNTPAAEGYYFGGVVGQNVGFVTNSRSSIKAQSLVSMGGVVGTNQGTIASSAFKEGLLMCNSTYNNVFVMGGLSAVNGENARIITSYVSGEVTADKVYADGTNSMLNSSVQVGGFVHTNQGIIEDCYSNIPILTSSRSAGFVFTNLASIERCFSTSKITGDNSATNYYFAGDGNGTFADCYYIRGNNINVTLSPLSHEGVSQLTYNENNGQVTRNDFANLSQYFANYSYSNTPAYNSVWFYSDGSTTDRFNGQQFAGGRLELVSANIIATSQKQNIGTTTDANGMLVYQYATAEGTPEDGSVFNPYVLYSAESMENYLVTPSKIASGNYRLACDISYSSLAVDYTSLYQLDFRGNLEGNGATISGIQLTSSSASESAGLFASITGVNNVNAAVMNLTLVPQEVAFTNANIVGSVAGTLQNANLYNITVYGSTAGMDTTEADEIVTVTGKNIVGGVIGLTLGSYDIKNIDSLIGAFATYVPGTSAVIDYESEDLSQLSFAGGVIGYMGGRGTLSGTTVSRGAINILGAKAGLAFGGIARSASANNVFVSVNASMRINAYRYGGFISGEIKGSLSNAYVYDYGVTGATFTLSPYVADAIGGITGLLRNGGRVTTAYMQQGYVIGNQPTATVDVNTVDSVGGIVGVVQGSNNIISQVIVDGNMIARSTLGGVVGEVATGAQVTISQAGVKDITLEVEGQTANPIIGGIIGLVNDTATVSISDSYSQATSLTIDTYTYSMAITARFGGIIGMSSASSLTLINIYTTSVYNITVGDNNSSSVAAQVRSVQVSGNGNPTYFEGGTRYFAIAPNVYADWGAWHDEEDAKGVSYSIGGTATTISNVYNSSLSGAWSEEVDILAYGYTTVTAKKGDMTISINQNEYGTGLYTATSEDNAEPIAISEALTGLYNKFAGNALWVTSSSALSTLAFEQNLLI